jgi:hypothetical protein
MPPEADLTGTDWDYTPTAKPGGRYQKYYKYRYLVF